MNRTLRSAPADGLRWVHPSHQLREALVLSSVLRAGHVLTGERFGLVRSQPCSTLFSAHPAIARIAIPGPGATVIFSEAPADERRPFARLALALFGRELAEQAPWLAARAEDVEALRGLPFDSSPVLLAPGGDDALQCWPASYWVELGARLAERLEAPVVVAGHRRLPGPQGTINVSGKLSPRELVALVGRSQACISVDGFISSAARLHAVPTLALFGPRAPELDGFEGQIQVQALGQCEGPCGAGGRCSQPQRCLAGLLPQTVLGLFDAHLAPKIQRAPLLPGWCLPEPASPPPPTPSARLAVRSSSPF